MKTSTYNDKLLFSYDKKHIIYIFVWKLSQIVPYPKTVQTATRQFATVEKLSQNRVFYKGIDKEKICSIILNLDFCCIFNIARGSAHWTLTGDAALGPRFQGYYSQTPVCLAVSRINNNVLWILNILHTTLTCLMFIKIIFCKQINPLHLIQIQHSRAMFKSPSTSNFLLLVIRV